MPGIYFTYDLDGNQTADARWNYTWDGENRMILVEEKVIPVAVAAGVSMPAITTGKRGQCGMALN
jgi:hypothetical protein